MLLFVCVWFDNGYVCPLVMGSFACAVVCCVVGLLFAFVCVCLGLFVCVCFCLMLLVFGCCRVCLRVLIFACLLFDNVRLFVIVCGCSLFVCDY